MNITHAQWDEIRKNLPASHEIKTTPSNWPTFSVTIRDMDGWKKIPKGTKNVSILDLHPIVAMYYVMTQAMVDECARLAGTERVVCG